jgi:hypothetical protein
MSHARHLYQVSLSCPSLDTTGLAAEIRGRGNVPLRIADSVLMELPMHTLRQSWASTLKLPAQKVAALSWQLAHDISEDEEPHSHSREAAALFLLALRHNHASLERAIAGCTIRWNGAATSEQVEYLT